MNAKLQNLLTSVSPVLPWVLRGVFFFFFLFPTAVARDAFKAVNRKRMAVLAWVCVGWCVSTILKTGNERERRESCRRGFVQ